MTDSSLQSFSSIWDGVAVKYIRQIRPLSPHDELPESVTYIHKE